ncbi:hypothetical protein PYCCODRAFT_1435586 [Trametes coccinea BRFM310]|uniref:DUF6534 domain-containing protein n=1 Tax=Trametes coccinea (strain BRFM310) TaxID=1353009 RepID=A0A1Y2INK0_TRAC3|nr:hypothetical protein PYCCODRAFT_1435586 [Trametes coccinea BRFM310]
MLPILRTNLLHVLPRTPGLPSLNSTFGAILIGSYIGFIIYGLNLYQTLHYFKAFPNDRLYLKILVGVVLALETWHTALCMHTCYHYLVTNYFNPLALLEGCVPISLACIAAGLSIITCQTFFVRRVYLIVGWRWRILIAAVILFLLAELALAIAATIETFLKPTFAQFEHVTWIISVAFGFSAVADITLTTVLICALRRCRTGIKSTDSLLDTLIIYAISTGLLTGVFDLLTFIFALIRPNDLIFFGVDIVATKLYPTSLLTALNARHMLAKQSSGAAAIYGESGIVSVSTEHKRSAFAVNRLVSPRDTTDHESSRGEAIEMNVKANHVYNSTGDVGPQAPVISIGPLGSGLARSQSESA